MLDVLQTGTGLMRHIVQSAFHYVHQPLIIRSVKIHGTQPTVYATHREAILSHILLFFVDCTHFRRESLRIVVVYEVERMANIQNATYNDKQTNNSNE